MSPIDELVPLLKKLRLNGILQTLELRTQQAADDSLFHAEFLLRLLILRASQKRVWWATLILN